MSARGYFSLRYALPGFTFILMVVLVILGYLKTLFQVQTQPNLSFDPSLVSAFIAFFTLLEGGALGFLVSQPWHLFYDFVLRQNALLPARAFLQQHYRLIDTCKHIHKQTAFLDYITCMADKQLLTYLQRRWDLLHTIGSALMAVLVGSFVGFLFRTLWLKADLWVSDYLAIVAFPLVIVVLIGSYVIVNGEHERMTLAAVRSVWYSGKFPPEDASRVFPPEYFQQTP